MPNNTHTYYSPSGNPEIWEEKPEGYITQEEWDAARAAEEAAAEAERLAEYNKPENARVRKYTEINEGCQAALAALTATYPDRELLTFDKQEAEARAYLSDPSSATTPILTAIAQGRGIPVDELAQKIIAKADAFALASGALIGQRQWYEDALESLGPDATTAQIEDITISYSAAAVATQEATDGDSSALPGADGSAS